MPHQDHRTLYALLPSYFVPDQLSRWIILDNTSAPEGHKDDKEEEPRLAFSSVSTNSLGAKRSTKQ